MISQTTIRYYTESDPYYWTTDNRPISDLAANQAILASILALFTSKQLTLFTNSSGTLLTAASMLGGSISRTGPIANYGDIFDSAANIVAAIPNAFVGMGLEFTVSNTVAFTNTVTAGAGVTLTGITAIAASSSRKYLLIINNVSTPAVTITGISSGGL